MSLSERTDRFADPTFNWHWANFGDAFSQYATAVLPLVLLRGDRHGPGAAHRLPARVRHRVPRRAVQERAARPRRRAVLHELPHPHAGVEDHPRRPGLRSSASSATLGIIGNERQRCSARRTRSSAGSPTTSCRSWCCRSTSRLEKIDPRSIDAARDLYSNTWRAFRKVVFPMSLPGVFAGSLLVFIPAAGDFVNAYYLGSAKTTMIGNVVQDQFLVQGDYPVAAALSFVFMAIVMVLVTCSTRACSAPRTRRERRATGDRRHRGHAGGRVRPSLAPAAGNGVLAAGRRWRRCTSSSRSS